MAQPPLGFYREWSQNENIHYNLHSYWLREKGSKWHQCLQEVKTSFCLQLKKKIVMASKVQIFFMTWLPQKFKTELANSQSTQLHCTAHNHRRHSPFNQHRTKPSCVCRSKIYLQVNSMQDRLATAVGPCWQRPATSPTKFVRFSVGVCWTDYCGLSDCQLCTNYRMWACVQIGTVCKSTVFSMKRRKALIGVRWN